ncbi:MAG TPA: ATP-binding cassette domain-containing protein, partial [Actinocrinis sp.]|uniref:ABC transporter ATP-binding protein n=1 Tax=Actinocrinis sp. TaxID=1920516 RepID=UPI002DDC9379
ILLLPASGSPILYPSPASGIVVSSGASELVLTGATTGTIVSGGTEVTALRGGALAAYRRTVGFVFQRYNLLPALTALDNVIAPVLPYRTGWDKPERARQLLDAVGLGGRERSLPARMSGGEQQRVAIARALVTEPRFLLADEPTGNLDTANGDEVMAILESLNKERGVAVVLVTHEAEIAARARRLIRMRDGLVVEDTGFEHPALEETAFEHPALEHTRIDAGLDDARSDKAGSGETGAGEAS